MTQSSKVEQVREPQWAGTSPVTLTLADLVAGQRGIVVGFDGKGSELGRRLTAFGLVRGTEITVDRTAPMGNPRAYTLLGYRLSLRNEDARSVLLRIE
ncbi:ferrous iron transport protein A [uncultured Gammaproteobacteria bacterium]